MRMVPTEQKKAFKARVNEWAEKLDVGIVWLGVRPMTNKWASCSTNGHLNFSTDLLELDRDLWDYVIVHELLHFSVPNHGKLWKSLMRAHLGAYEDAEKRLRQVAGLRPRKRSATGPEPKQLREGKEFHQRVQEEWQMTAEGKVEPEKGMTKVSGGHGRIDIMVDAGEDTKALVEIKNTDWDRMTEAAMRRSVRRQIKQVWDYIEAQPNEADGVCPGIIFPKRPADPECLRWIEETFLDEGIPVVWQDETIEEHKKREGG